jgi:hypothetical protein
MVVTSHNPRQGELTKSIFLDSATVWPTGGHLPRPLVLPKWHFRKQ